MRHEKPSKGKIIVFGIFFGYPLAGVTYQFLHYLIGLRRLGYDPYYVEDSSRWVYNPWIHDTSPDPVANITAMAPVLEAHGFAGRWVFRGNPDGQCYGMTEAQLLQLYREADAMLNVTASQELREEHLVCPRRIYVESDPFTSQVPFSQGEPVMVRQLHLHDTHFSFGENLGAPDCDVPVEPFRWLPTRQPVLLDMWDNPYSANGTGYRTITTWRNKGKNLTHRGETYYWTKNREFRKFLDLPRQCPVPFELALGNVHNQLHCVLNHRGWSTADGLHISEDTERYRGYIQRSRGEFTVARDQYVRPYTGWFSDRSACYLAAGRPVITQETGFSKFLPTGRGLFAFRTMQDVLTALDAIESDWEGHCRAAREIAAEYFAAEKVVGSLMERAGL